MLGSFMCFKKLPVIDLRLGRLDAVQDLLDHPTFEAEFTEIAKGLPDLERIVSRIHAKNCRVRDFIKVLTVRLGFLLILTWSNCLMTAFAGFQKAQQRSQQAGGPVRVFQVDHYSGLTSQRS